MGKLIITKSPSPLGLSVTIAGEAGIENVETLEAEFNAIGQLQPRAVLCDLSQLTFINSAGMGAFLKLRSMLAKQGGSIQLAEVSPEILESFRRARLDRMFKFVKAT